MANKNNKGYNMSNQYNEFLAKDKTDVIRGIAIISIILYHLTISGISNLLLFPFQFMQFCGVATFFLLSGYALMEQYQSRKNYLNGFLLKKLSRIYFSYILMFIPYLIYELCINSKINWIEELLGILTFSFEGHRLWYLCAQVIFYIAFYLIFRINKIDNKMKVFLTFIFIGLYTVLCVLLKFDKIWYFNAFYFPIGLIVSYNKRIIFDFLNKFKVLIAILSGLLLLSIYFVLFKFGYNFGNLNLYIPLQIVYVFCAVIFLIVLSFFVNKKLKLLALVGTYSMELYITHSIIVMGIYDYKLKSPVEIVVYFVASIIFSIVIKFIVQKVFKNKKVRGKTKC